MDNQMSSIEKQFPVSKVSKESYKERKANNGQTLELQDNYVIDKIKQWRGEK